MTDKSKFWISGLDGTKALVEGAETRDEWVKLRGWSEAVEPGGADQVWMWHPDVELPARFPAAAAESWSAMGWAPGAPPEPVDTTKDPAFVDQPRAAPVAKPAKSEKPAAADTTIKEK